MFREVINLILTLLLFVGSVYLLQIFNLALWAREARSSVLTPGSVMLTEKAMLPLHVLTPQKKAADFVAVTKLSRAKNMSTHLFSQWCQTYVGQTCTECKTS